MHRINRQQKEKVQQFVNITGASERVAVSMLKAGQWNVEVALELFFSSASSDYYSSTSISRPSVDASRLEALFAKYKDPKEDMVLAEGISSLCEDLQVEPSDPVMLVLSHRMQAATMCEYTKQEFISGLRSLGVDSVEGLRNALAALRAELNDENKFREIYYFAFGWSKEKGQKSLALDTALGMWRLLFGHRRWPLVEHWCHFLEVKHNKAISRDTWNQLWDFSKLGELSGYDDKGAWPYLIDEFVLYLRESGVIPKEPEPS